MVTQPDIVPVQRAALFKGHGLDAAGATWFDRHAASAGRVGPLVAALEDVVGHEREDPYRVLGAAKTTFAVLRGFFDGLGDDRATRARIGAAA
jgi:hypothetical protein